jgi:hypothetical protein
LRSKDAGHSQGSGRRIRQLASTGRLASGLTRIFLTLVVRPAIGRHVLSFINYISGIVTEPVIIKSNELPGYIRMDDSHISRRRFILAAVAASSVIPVPRNWLPGNIAWAETPANPALIQLARLLFPHAGLADDVYADVVEILFTSFAAHPESGQLLDVAESALDAQLEGNWFDADEDSQIAAIRNIQGEAFFAAILAGLRSTFYYHPKVWAHLDYPGSSKEYGGYQHRGFNDISWLPKVE